MDDDKKTFSEKFFDETELTKGLTKDYIDENFCLSQKAQRIKCFKMFCKAK